MKKITRTFLALVVTVFVMVVCLIAIAPKVDARVVEDVYDVKKTQFSDTRYYQYDGTGFKVEGDRAGASYVDGNTIKTPVYKGEYKKNTDFQWLFTSWSSWSWGSEYYYKKAQNNDYTTYRGTSTTEYKAESKRFYEYKHVGTGELRYEEKQPILKSIWKPTGASIMKYRYKTRSMSWDAKATTTLESDPLNYSLYDKNGKPIKSGVLVYTSGGYDGGQACDKDYRTYYCKQCWQLPINASNTELIRILFDLSQKSEEWENVFEDILIGEMIGALPYVGTTCNYFRDITNAYADSVNNTKKVSLADFLLFDVALNPNNDYIIKIYIDYSESYREVSYYNRNTGKNEVRKIDEGSYKNISFEFIKNIDHSSEYFATPIIYGGVHNLLYIDGYSMLINDLKKYMD